MKASCKSPPHVHLCFVRIDKMDEDAQQSAAKIRRQPVYTVRIREQTFRLSESQIHFDTPNYFSLAFSDDWIEGETREIDILDRNPELFRAWLRSR